MSTEPESTQTVDIVAMAKEQSRREQSERRAQTWGGKQFRRFRARTIVQSAFFLICVMLGVQFYRFVHAALTNAPGALPMRPPGVDGFLPITGLMGIFDWYWTGTLNSIHPAATILLLLFIAISFIWRKAFCSWICPVGAISEWLAMLGRKLFGRNFRIWQWLDINLRGLKYLILGFFVSAFFAMGSDGINAFLFSDYNYVADVKMGMFFVRMGTVGMVVMTILIVGSVFVYGFWCRYLCPYGALVGLFSWMSPTKIVRNAEQCIDCGICDKVCPSRLPVMTKPKIISVECTGCLDCVAACPVPPALNVQQGARKISVKRTAIHIAALFVVVWISAQLLGGWHNSVTDEQYRERIPKMDQYGHPGR